METKFDISKIKIECNAEELQLLTALAMKTVFVECSEKFTSQMSLLSAYLVSFLVDKDTYLAIARNMVEKAKKDREEV